MASLELEEQKKARKEIIDAWTKLGLCEGLQGYVKDNGQIMFKTKDGEELTLPIVRKVY